MAELKIIKDTIVLWDDKHYGFISASETFPVLIDEFIKKWDFDAFCESLETVRSLVFEKDKDGYPTQYKDRIMELMKFFENFDK